MFWSLALDHNELRGHEAEGNARQTLVSPEDFPSNLRNTCYKFLIVDYICAMLHNVAVHPSPKLEISLENIQTRVRKDDVLDDFTVQPFSQWWQCPKDTHFMASYLFAVKLWRPKRIWCGKIALQYPRSSATSSITLCYFPSFGQSRKHSKSGNSLLKITLVFVKNTTFSDTILSML